jgi:hypothetical protein
MSKATANGRHTAVKEELDAHLAAHAKSIEDLHKKIKAIPGAVDAGNEARVDELFARARQQHEWLKADAHASIPPTDGPPRP